MTGRELKARLAQLMHRHNVRPLERAPIPLKPPTAGPQIIEGYAATPDIDADRMSFKRGSLTWPGDLRKLPLLVRHDSSKIAGKLLAVEYLADGKLFVRARVDDPEARCMGGFSIAATVVESAVRDEDSAWFHFVITKATVNEISLTPIPANACAIVTGRRDVGPMDHRHDEVLASLGRFGKGLGQLQAALSGAQLPPPKPAPGRPAYLTLGAAPAHIYGTLPRAILQRKKTPFGALVSAMEGNHYAAG